MNRIQPVSVGCEGCPRVTDPTQIAERFQEMLADESRLRADTVSAIYLPESVGQLAGALAAISAEGRTCVVSGGRTGITGAAAPIDADVVVSLVQMKRLLAFGRDSDEAYVRVESGLTLSELNEALAKKKVEGLPGATDAEAEAAKAFANGDEALWFPVDPTETTAHLGGMAATNASGARTLRYGSTRAWVRGLTVVLADGRVLTVRRGEVATDGRTFALVNADGGEATIELPEIEMPQTKCTAGYFMAPGMDLVDLLVGSEGTLGAFAEVELRLAPRPPAALGVLAVVPDEDKALALVEAARAHEAVTFDAIEYFDHDALALLKDKKENEGATSEIPEIPSWDGAAVYLELSGTDDETEAACETLEELLASVGSSIDETWAAMEPAELEEQKAFRHAVPEAVNTLIGQRATQHPGLHKVGTDMAVPDDKLRDVFRLYREGLAEAGLASVIFGHIGNNHAHVNILPRDLDELGRAKALYQTWAAAVVDMGGAVSAEHGIGRIKKSMLELQYPADALEAMRAVRRAFDPQGTLGPGVVV